MSSQKTTNYDLNQWLPADSVLRADFNADNAKIDAALQALADTAAGKADAGDLSALENTVAGQAAQIAQKGNCMIVYGTYTGTGGYGSSSPNTLTFGGTPILVFVSGNPPTSDPTYGIVAMRGWTRAFSSAGEGLASSCTVAWGDTSLSWWGSSSGYQFNASGITYPYVALLAADE